MKRTIAILLSAVALASCAIQPYQAPNSDKTATILFDGSKMTRTPFAKRKLDVKVFNSCYEKKLSEGALGSAIIEESGFSKKGITVLAEKKMYISYGQLSFCMLNWSFVPEAGITYLATYDNEFGGCRGNLSKLEGEKIIEEPTAKFLKLGTIAAAFGATNAWRQCKNISD